jgi:sodium-independent sulfate anion transporter 11
VTQDRPWNDPAPRKGAPTVDEHKPTLKAVILDFSSVNNVDLTSVQNLIDVRNQLDRYAAPDMIEWHFASVNNRWTKRALAAAGFGMPAALNPNATVSGATKAIFSVAEIGGASTKVVVESQSTDVEVAKGAPTESEVERRVVPTHGVNLPFFHVDLVSAVQAALLQQHAKPVPV